MTWRWAVLGVFLVLVGCDADGDGADASVDGSSSGMCADDDECADDVFCNGIERCNPASADADERGCVPPTPSCLASQTCDEDTDQCVSDCSVNPDADGDGRTAVLCGGDDCDDADAARFPGNAEVCDALDHDEDCDVATFGERDGDSDGQFDAMCCNRSVTGERTCGTDCDDTAAGVNTSVPEVCDMVDNDCDGDTDEGFECMPGATRACSVCGRTGEGSQTCDASVCAWGPCEAEEACNACDDDGDGSTDEGFLCVRGATTACTTDCGVASEGTCSLTCDGVDSCQATEVCNYCDDDGDGVFHDETALAVIESRAVFNCDGDAGLPTTLSSVEMTLIDATCESGVGNLRRVQVLDTTTRSDSGAMTYELPIGFGEIQVTIQAQMNKSFAAGSTGGWATVFIAEGSLGLVNDDPGYDRSRVRRGLAVEWHFNGLATDRIALVRLDGSSAGVEIDSSDIGNVASGLDGAGPASQTLHIAYTPDNGSTGVDENRARIAHFNPESFGNSVENVRLNGTASTLADELVPGDMVTLAFVAGESSSLTEAHFNAGFDHPFRAQSFAEGESLCEDYP